MQSLCSIEFQLNKKKKYATWNKSGVLADEKLNPFSMCCSGLYFDI